MTDRGPAPDTSLACPFVAFEDDRDGRSTRPDHRHRCFAELRPAPRASAHQEAYCLSAGFAACPTFVDWARREAARVRPTGQAPTTPPPLPPVVPSPPESRPASATAPAAPAAPPTTPAVDTEEAWVARDSRRDWAAPPPWAAPTAGAAAGAAAAGAATGPEPALEPTAPKPTHESEPASSPMSTAAPTPEPPIDEDDEPELAVAAPSFLAARTTPPRTTYPAADLDDELEAGAATDEEWAELDPGEPPMRRFGPAAGHTRHDDAHATASRPPSRRRPPADPEAPSWEKPRRFEAYPTLRTRTGLSGLSPLLLAGVGIVLVAAALFFLPSLLIGLGGDGDTEPTPSASGATASATPVVSPSPSPAPTPFVYVVKEGDTLSSIAVEFEVPLDDLIAANRATLPDPDKLGIGDELIIPIGGYEPSPSAAPEEPSPSP